MPHITLLVLAWTVLYVLQHGTDAGRKLAWSQNKQTNMGVWTWHGRGGNLKDSDQRRQNKQHVAETEATLRVFPYCIQEHGLSVWEQDLLISRAYFGMLSHSNISCLLLDFLCSGLSSCWFCVHVKRLLSDFTSALSFYLFCTFNFLVQQVKLPVQ